MYGDHLTRATLAVCRCMQTKDSHRGWGMSLHLLHLHGRRVERTIIRKCNLAYLPTSMRSPSLWTRECMRLHRRKQPSPCLCLYTRNTYTYTCVDRDSFIHRHVRTGSPVHSLHVYKDIDRSKYTYIQVYTHSRRHVSLRQNGEFITSPDMPSSYLHLFSLVFFSIVAHARIQKQEKEHLSFWDVHSILTMYLLGGALTTATWG